MQGRSHPPSTAVPPAKRPGGSRRGWPPSERRSGAAHPPPAAGGHSRSMVPPRRVGPSRWGTAVGSHGRAPRRRGVGDHRAPPRALPLPHPRQKRARRTRDRSAHALSPDAASALDRRPTAAVAARGTGGKHPPPTPPQGGPFPEGRSPPAAAASHSEGRSPRQSAGTLPARRAGAPLPHRAARAAQRVAPRGRR